MSRRLFTFLAILAVPAAVGLAIPASAAPSTPLIVSCKSLKGATATGPGVLSGCNNTTLTGGSGTTSSKPPAFSIKFKTGKTATGKESYTTVSPNKCPAPYNSIEIKATVTITGGTLTQMKGGSGVSLICVSSKQAYENLPGTLAKF